jgi:hypothetical protein
MAFITSAFDQNSLIGKQQPQILQQPTPQYSIQYPFWTNNMRQLLMIAQQTPYGGDKFMNFSINAHGLKNSIDMATYPFYILCPHQQTMSTKTGSKICSNCGLFLQKSQQDQQQLEQQCTHPLQYCIISKGNREKTCGQCNKKIEKSNINNIINNQFTLF